MSRYKHKTADDEEHRRWNQSRAYRLKIMQHLPLDLKIPMSLRRIEEAIMRYGPKAIYVSDSTGKDSAVLSHLARQVCPDILHIYGNSTNEYSESLQYAREQKQVKNLIIVKPKKWNFIKLLDQHGYPMFSKEISRQIRLVQRARTPETRQNSYDYFMRHFKRYEKYMDLKISDRCCDYLKKEPIHRAEKEYGLDCCILGVMADESRVRRFSWIDHGCNVFEDTATPRSRPLSFWSEKDIWEYIHRFNLKVSEIYTKHGYRRNGCMFCGFGCHLNSPNHIQRLYYTHPKAHAYVEKHFAPLFEACDVPWHPDDKRTWKQRTAQKKEKDPNEEMKKFNEFLRTIGYRQAELQEYLTDEE